jgi:hypothetical protein
MCPSFSGIAVLSVGSARFEVVAGKWLKSFKGLAEEDIDDNDNRISRESVAAR